MKEGKGGSPRGKLTPEQASRPEQKHPSRKAGKSLLRSPFTPQDQRGTYTQEQYEREREEKLVLMGRLGELGDDPKREEEIRESTRILIKRIIELDKRQDLYRKEQQKKEKEQRRLARLELKALREADAAERELAGPETRQIFPAKNKAVGIPLGLIFE